MTNSRKSYIIHWSSSTPITAWCEVNTKNPLGKTNEGIVKCEMDASDPKTQTRSTQENCGTGRNLCFSGRRPAGSSHMGIAWLEIRRATAIEVTEISTQERKLTIHWVPTDRPDTGKPYATFVFNFETNEQQKTTATATATTLASPPKPLSSLLMKKTSNPYPPGPRVFEGGSKCFSGFIVAGPRNDYPGRSISPTVTESNTPVSENTVEHLIAESVIDRDVKEKLIVAAKEPVVENNPDISKNNSSEDPTVVAEKSSAETAEVPPPTSPNEDLGIATEPIVNIPAAAAAETIPRDIESTQDPDPGLSSQKRAREESSEPAVHAQDDPQPKRLRSNSDAPANTDDAQTTREEEEEEELLPELLMDVSDEEWDDFDESKIAILDTEIENYVKNIEKLSDKQKYMEVKRQKVRSISGIKDLEIICGPLVSRRPTQIIEGEESEEEDYKQKTIHIEETLPSLDLYLSALDSKKIYLEKKAKVKRLKRDLEAAEQRCNELSVDITDILSKTPKIPKTFKTPKKLSSVPLA